MVRVTNLFIVAASALGFTFGVRVMIEMKIWCIEGIYMQKVVCKLGVKGSYLG